MEINLKKKKILANTNNLFSWRNDDIKFVDDYGSIILEVTRKANGEELKKQQKKNKKATEPAKAKTECDTFLGKTKNEEKNIYQQMFRDHFVSQTPLYLTNAVVMNLKMIGL